MGTETKGLLETIDNLTAVNELNEKVISEMQCGNDYLRDKWYAAKEAGSSLAEEKKELEKERDAYKEKAGYLRDDNTNLERQRDDAKEQLKLVEKERDALREDNARLAFDNHVERSHKADALEMQLFQLEEKYDLLADAMSDYFLRK